MSHPVPTAATVSAVFEQTGVKFLLYKCRQDGWMIKRAATLYDGLADPAMI
jgi:hypothetical protein